MRSTPGNLHIANAKKALGEAVAELDTKGTYSETFNIVVMRAYLDANPELVKKFIAALIETETWVKAHPAEAIATVADAVGMKRDDLQPIWSDYVYHRPDRRPAARNPEDPRRMASGQRQSSAGRRDAGLQQGNRLRAVEKPRPGARDSLVERKGLPLWPPTQL